MKVLLINPNQYQSPPVPPIGLEHLAAALHTEGHEALLLDVCFSDDPIGEIDRTAELFRPDIAALTVRNIDTVLYDANEFFLGSLKNIVIHLKANHRLKVLAGGAGVISHPRGIIDYLGADAVIAGPAEGDIGRVVRELKDAPQTGRIFYGRYYDRPWGRCTEMTDYRRYFSAGGIAGFETHKGCSSSCIYCIEADTPVVFRDPRSVIAEISSLVSRGFDHFHLCDSEFNEDLDYCLDFCSSLRGAGIGIRWAVYMKPGNYSQKLFRLMHETGVYLVTLTVDSFRKCPLYWEDVEKMVNLARSSGIRMAVDFLTGFPYEICDDTAQYLDAFRRIQPDTVGVNTYIRLYQSLEVSRIIRDDPGLGKYLLGNIDDVSLVRPVFYNHIDAGRLEGLIGSDPLFRIEGRQKGVNYVRAQTG